ncbi:MAG TPA: DUF262 domain-containing HNH endonuclease family protein [Candidatus Angelobacter sp.]|nr:DUF262 domain-containing HNH endonuclease family protein [Candidatus Angelobacter sp.]
MPKRNRLTNNSDETELASLLSGDTVFAIPYFQRAYKWKPERIQQLNRDLLDLVDESSDFHFLGAIIIHGRRSNPSDPDVYEVIDGQQRITTIFLYLCAIVRTLCKKGEYGDAAGLFQKYLVIGRETALASNSKLHSGKEDRAQLNYVMNDLMSDPQFAERVAPFRYKPLPATGLDSGKLRNNYRAMLKFFEEQVEKENIDRLRSLYQALLESMSVVQIDVWDPINGPKIFDSLNSRQEPMTTGDLVRNEIFSKVANAHPDSIEEIDQRSWQPFYSKFRQNGKDLFDSYFFPYGLIQDPNLRKSEVYAKLREKWRSIADPEIIVKELSAYQDAFLDLELGSNRQEHHEDIQRALAALHEAGIPSSTYPFLMQLSNALKNNSVNTVDGVAIIQVIESFLVRRAISGHEPTGLHAVFKRLWSDCEADPTSAKVEAKIREHKTVVWPGDDDVRAAVIKRPLYGASITRYLLLEWNRSLGGDQPGIVPWIEHILPDKPDEEWFTVFSEQQHQTMKDLLANLLPLSREMNQSLGNNPYAAKRQVYCEDSGFKAARKFGEAHSVWTPDLLEERSSELADWAIKRWPH